MAQFLVMLDTSVVNVALPTIQSELGLAPTGLAWVVNAYFLAFGGLLLVAGRAAEIFGGRRMFLIGATVVAAATVAAGFAPNGGVLVGARALQGVGAAALSTAALSLILHDYPGSHRAKAMGAWGAASAAGGAFGVALGGLVTSVGGWQWVFFLTTPIAIGAIIAAPSRLQAPRPERTRVPLDFLGALTITGASLALISAILSGADNGWDSPPTLLLIATTTGLVAAFIAVEWTAADPIIPLSVLRNPATSVGIGIGLVGGAARVSTFFLTALFLQQVLLLTPGIAGLAMVPTSVAGFVVSLLILPRVIRRLGANRTLLLGLLLLAVGHFWLARQSMNSSYGFDVLPGLLIAAAGVALSFTPSTMVIAESVPAERTGLASGLANASSQIGGAVGVSAFSSIAAIASGQQDSTAAGFPAAFIAAGVAALLGAALAAGLLVRLHHQRS
ncbi:MFS transporter [Cryobacterium sp. TmT2-59]|uniref:MFS transporter n=1 Tax=Cryobacterium sp. TmT2-59 TaxID=1259264 RepID=UPI00141AD93E|nr:MFS transporter [Cryobacterium sp. TmT2-59]